MQDFVVAQAQQAPQALRLTSSAGWVGAACCLQGCGCDAVCCNVKGNEDVTLPSQSRMGIGVGWMEGRKWVDGFVAGMTSQAAEALGLDTLRSCSGNVEWVCGEAVIVHQAVAMIQTYGEAGTVPSTESCTYVCWQVFWVGETTTTGQRFDLPPGSGSLFPSPARYGWYLTVSDACGKVSNMWRLVLPVGGR